MVAGARGRDKKECRSMGGSPVVAVAAWQTINSMTGAQAADTLDPTACAPSLLSISMSAALRT